MTVGFKVKFYWYQIGTGDFLHSFFSTVCYNLENGKWGNKYPCIMNELYAGELTCQNIGRAKNELVEIKSRFEEFHPDKAIWDMDDLSKKAPWGDNISPEITNLSNYFVTSEGEDFLTTFMNALDKAEKLNENLKICTM